MPTPKHRPPVIIISPLITENGHRYFMYISHRSQPAFRRSASVLSSSPRMRTAPREWASPLTATSSTPPRSRLPRRMTHPRRMHSMRVHSNSQKIYPKYKPVWGIYFRGFGDNLFLLTAVYTYLPTYLSESWPPIINCKDFFGHQKVGKKGFFWARQGSSSQTWMRLERVYPIISVYGTFLPWMSTTQNHYHITYFFSARMLYSSISFPGNNSSNSSHMQLFHSPLHKRFFDVENHLRKPTSLNICIFLGAKRYLKSISFSSIALFTTSG